MGLATVAFVRAERSDCPCRVLAVKAIQVSNLLFAFCRFRNKNLYCQKSWLIQAKAQSSNPNPQSRLPTLFSASPSLHRWPSHFHFMPLRFIRLAYPLVVCLCAINLLTKEGLLLDHAAVAAVCSEDEEIYIYIYM